MLLVYESQSCHYQYEYKPMFTNNGIIIYSSIYHIYQRKSEKKSKCSVKTNARQFRTSEQIRMSMSTTRE